MCLRHILKISILVLFLSTTTVFAQDHELENNHHEAEEAFDPGKFIFDHVGDAYEWHIMTLGETHISVPLPVILYSKEKGLKVFFSSKFHHGHESYDGYKIASEGPYEGKIVQLNADGSIHEEHPRPLDLSITKNAFAIIFSSVLLLIIFLSVSRRYQKNPNQAPKGLQSMMEPIILFIRDDIVIPSIGEKKYARYMPYLLTLFFFILLNNFLGLIPIFPGGANVTGNIAVTMVMALFTFFITTFSGNKNYWKHIFNAPGVPWWLKFPVPLMPFVEVLGLFTKPFVLMVRLFANITAGHIIALSFFSLIFIFGNMHIVAGYGVSIVSVAFTIFMTLLELLVAFIQAYVFTLLSALYFGMATEESH